MKMSNIDRVKYNESSMFGWVKERIDIVFMGLDHVQSTNDIIEIYNVVKYIKETGDESIRERFYFIGHCVSLRVSTY